MRQLQLTSFIAIALPLALVTAAHAVSPACYDLMAGARASGPNAVRLTSLQALGLDHPEIEAKMQIPDQETLERLKLLVGTEITLPDADGKPVVFTVEMNKEHIYEDLYFDVIDKNKDLVLYGKEGLLRQRVRYDKLPGQTNYKFAKIVFQAKNGAIQFQGLNPSLFARNEVRGEEGKDQKKFEKKRDDLFDHPNRDDALKYARKLAGPKGDFRPVLFSRDTRFFMKVTPKFIPGEPIDKNVPSFYVSLDQVENKGLVQKKDQGTNRELEPEIIDELEKDSPRVMRRKVLMLSRLSDWLMTNYGLTPSERSKYQTGIESSVLKK